MGQRRSGPFVSNESHPILLIDRNTRNLELLAGFLETQGYSTLRLNNLDELEPTIAELSGVALALVDISGFDRNIWTYCQLLSERDIPFVVISPKQVKTIREEGRSHGASDVLMKPLVAKELTILIRSLIGSAA
jgi:DNA-binding response OmpR family regulator